MARKTYRKPLKPVQENNSFAIDADEPKLEPNTNPTDSEHITDSASLDSYLDIAERENSLPTFEKDAEIDELKRQLSEVVTERDELRHRIAKLENEIKEHNDTTPAGMSNVELERQIESLKGENERLRGSVSNLEKENRTLLSSLRVAQVASTRMLHSYAKPGYNVGSGVRTLKNGCQEWI